MGDTTQIHTVTTIRGDIFTGRVLEFDENEITFIYGKNTLVFGVDEIKLIEVKDGTQTTPNSDSTIDTVLVERLNPNTTGGGYLWRFEYKVRINNGKEYIGKLKELNQNFLLLDNGKNGQKTFTVREVREIIHFGRNPLPNPTLFPEYHRLTTKDRNSFIGILLEFDGHEITFMLKSGSELKFKLNEVTQLILEENIETKWLPKSKLLTDYSKNQQRVFWAPSAFTLEKGTNEFRTMVLFNTIDHGLTDNITIGTGLFSVLVASAFTGKVKLGVSLTDHLHVAVGAQGLVAFSTFDGGDVATLGLIYGSIAVGTTDNFVNISLGRGNDNQGGSGSTGLGVGTRFRMGENLQFFLEYMQFQEGSNQYYSGDKTSFGNLGFSWIKYQHQLDVGLMVSSFYNEDAIGLPIFAYSYKF